MAKETAAHNILVLGSGGREHALAWKLRQSPLCAALFIAPGNAGTSSVSINAELDPNNFRQVAEFCLAQNISLLVVGPEEPLVRGISDHFAADAALQHIRVIGPSAKGAQLEGSKDFSKAFMQRHSIPTAAYATFTRANYEEGLQYLSKHDLPIVLKADGLAAGKGVVICETHEHAAETFRRMILEEQFGEASQKVVVEQFLQGIEISIFALTDGREYCVIGHAKDYKRVGEGDTGPNTGGMGCVTPVPFANESFLRKAEERIIRPTVLGLNKEGIGYAGFIFFGLINVGGEPCVIEYNCRMGDPETEVVIPRLGSDLAELLLRVHDGGLEDFRVEQKPGSFVTIVAVSEGYPGAYQKGRQISGLDPQTASGDALVFHAGTKMSDSGAVTSGGRVLAVTAHAGSIPAAAAASRAALDKIHFEGLTYRQDIGYEFGY